MEARVQSLTRRLAARGLDLVAPYPLEGRCGIVVGNTRALWEHFVRARPAGPDPLDAYVVDAIEAAAALLDVPYEIRWAHTMPPTIAIQRAAETAGLAWLSPSHLSVHAIYGPWIALRAVIVCDLPVAPVAPAVAPCSCADGCGPALARALAAGPLQNHDHLRDRWRLWLDVRDACPVGRAHRYSTEQIAHHYLGADPGEIPGR